jgi:hypothetical protein
MTQHLRCPYCGRLQPVESGRYLTHLDALRQGWCASSNLTVEVVRARQPRPPHGERRRADQAQG